MAKKKVHVARKSATKKKKVTKPAARVKGTGSPAKAAAVEHLNWVHAYIDKCLSTMPEDKLMFQATTADNHALWTMGHLAASYAWFASLLDGKPQGMPDGFDKLFGMGSKPLADPAAYPAPSEVRRHYAGAYRRFTDAIAAIPAKDLDKPTVADSYGFAKNRLDVVYKAAWHDGWHTGQLSTLRRALGLPGLF